MPGQGSTGETARSAAGGGRVWPGAIGLLVALAITQLACTNIIALPATPQNATISGKVYGDRLQDQQAGKTVAAPLQATVACNGIGIKTRADGGYTLSVPQATQYACSASAPQYVAGQAVLVGSLGPHFHLDFGGPVRVTSCATTPRPATTTPGAAPSPTHPSASATPTATAAPAGSVFSAELVCPNLHLVPGSITGVVTSADDHTPLTGARLTCWNPHGPDEDTTATNSYQTETDDTGAFAFADLPVDRYLCTAGSDPMPTVVSPSPGASTTVRVTACGKHCPPVAYQGGPVMHSMTVYLVFWLPSGHMYSSVGDAHFESVIQHYFRDVGGSDYYNILTQYWDTDTGFMLNQVTLGDVFVDTHAYPHASTRADPLLPSDIEQEARAAATTHGWTSDMTHMIFIFTAYDAQICDGSAAELCTYPGGSQEVFCGYHSITNQSLIFALIANTESCSGSADDNPYGSPNGDRLADEALITTSHEQFEAATDPDAHGWYSGNASTGEIADKCVQSHRSVTLSGHPYWVQAEWSDRANSCVYGL